MSLERQGEKFVEEPLIVKAYRFLRQNEPISQGASVGNGKIAFDAQFEKGKLGVIKKGLSEMGIEYIVNISGWVHISQEDNKETRNQISELHLPNFFISSWPEKPKS